MSTPYRPPGWPDEVALPGSPAWAATATAFLLDCCPADFRGYGVLRRQPLVLAEFAGHFLAGQRRAAEEGLPTLRANLRRHVDPGTIEDAVQVWLEQSARLARTQRAVALVTDALRGREFVPTLDLTGRSRAGRT